MAMQLTKSFRWLPIAAALAFAGALMAPKPAQAHIHFGVFFAPPVLVGPPLYYYPAPVYYDPPPVYVAPPPPPAAPAGFTCDATPYVCPLPHAYPVGGPCACPAYGGSAAGTVR